MSTESPMLILSQDYELFFGQSGSSEKCLFEPCDALLKFAADHGVKWTFYVDAGMLQAMQHNASSDKQLAKVLAQVQAHIRSLAKAGHEIALHVHPHWEDTRWSGGRWDFSQTRYQLRDFDTAEIAGIFRRYSALLAELSEQPPTSYRAGGFCVEPFSGIGAALLECGISIDSSVVPGAILRDPEKGFDFRSAPASAWWRFDASPAIEAHDGRFLELPVTACTLPPTYYWGRVVHRLGGRVISRQFGDGSAKSIGKDEVLRRLFGLSRVSEASIDDAKCGHLLDNRSLRNARPVWHLMGHPKLLSTHSLETLAGFIRRHRIDRFATVDAAAAQLAG